MELTNTKELNNETSYETNSPTPKKRMTPEEYEAWGERIHQQIMKNMATAVHPQEMPEKDDPIWEWLLRMRESEKS